eukprot:10620165-Alexandrium_andersonii.AAC.1
MDSMWSSGTAGFLTPPGLNWCVLPSLRAPSERPTFGFRRGKLRVCGSGDTLHVCVSREVMLYHAACRFLH